LVHEEASRCLVRSDCVFLRTVRHGAAELLRRFGVRYTSLDEVLARAETGRDGWRRVEERVFRCVENGATVSYGVPGDPLEDGACVGRMIARARRKGLSVRLVPGVGYAAGVRSALDLPSLNRIAVCDVGLVGLPSPPVVPLVLVGAPSDDVFPDALARIRRTYGPGVRAVAIGWPSGESEPVATELDERRRWELPEHLPVAGRCVYVSVRGGGGLEAEAAPGEAFERLAAVVMALRAPNGCPWDKAQTHRSLRPYVLEEAYEVVDAVERGDANKLEEELGDLLLQVVLQAQLAAESGRFRLAGVVEGIAEKLVRRHPHVFGGVTAEDAAGAVRSWESVKRSEVNGDGGLLDDVAAALPALIRARKLQAKARQVGFDWERTEDVLAKVEEELAELGHALQSEDARAVEHEVGDLLFSIVNLCRFTQIDAELALADANDRFVRRFRRMERIVRARGDSLDELSLGEMDELWEEVKRADRRERAGFHRNHD